jgi:DNA-binding winged helix-turn-helix (wHTH) protein/tetratricopeptide (TPR) repeat protein
VASAVPTTGGQASVLQFGPFQLDLANTELRKLGKRIPLGPQAFKALAFLATHSGSVVTRADLCSEIWGPNTFVDFEQGLNFCIWTIREALGDNQKKPRYIETVVRRGYRFLAPARAAREIPFPSAEPAQGTRAGDAPSVHREGRCRLALSSFRNLTGDAAGEGLALALREVLLTELVADESFLVVQPSRELTAEAILEGALVSSANRIQLAIRVADLRTGAYVWASRCDVGGRDRAPRFDGVVSSLVAELREKVPAVTFAEPPFSLRSDVLDAYLQGRLLCNRRMPADLRGAIRCFEFVGQKAPEFARAFSGQALAAAVLAGLSGGRSEWEEKVWTAGSRALELDPAQADAHAALGLMESLFRLEWAGARRAFERAIELDGSRPTSHQWLSMVLAAQGQGAQALQAVRMAHWLDPDSPIIAANHVLLLYLTRHYQEAMETCRQALSSNPAFPWLHVQLGLLLEQQQKPAESLAEMEKAARFSKGHPNMLAGLCRAYARTGNMRKARQILRRLKGDTGGRPVSPYGVAACYSAIQEREEALEWLGIACERKEPTSAMLPVDPMFDTLRDDRRFAALARQFGFAAGRGQPAGGLAQIS